MLFPFSIGVGLGLTLFRTWVLSGLLLGLLRCKDLAELLLMLLVRVSTGLLFLQTTGLLLTLPGGLLLGLLR